LERKFQDKFQVLEAGAGSIDFNSHGALGGKLADIEDIQQEFNLEEERIIHIGDEGHIKNAKGFWGNDLPPADKVLVYNTGSSIFNNLLPGDIKHRVIETNLHNISTVEASYKLLQSIYEAFQTGNVSKFFYKP
jgi:hypothetical protein